MNRGSENKGILEKSNLILDPGKRAMIEELLREEFERDWKNQYGSEVSKDALEEMIDAAMTP